MKQITGKRGAIGEGMLMIYRLILVTAIALVVFGIFAVFYDYYINVKDVEAKILEKQLINCLAPEGVFDISKIKGYEKNIFEYCNIKNTDRFYARLSVLKNFEKAEAREVKDGDKLFVLEAGDSGKEWVKKLFESNPDSVKKILAFEPAKSNRVYAVNFIDGNTKIKTGIYTEVIVNEE
jgi:hypothetical protein